MSPNWTETQKQKLLHTVITAFCVDNRIVAIQIKEGKLLRVNSRSFYSKTCLMSLKSENGQYHLDYLHYVPSKTVTQTF